MSIMLFNQYEIYVKEPGPILVMEDDALLRLLECRALALEGYEVLSAPHGQAALEIVKNHPPALILLNLDIPVLDGRRFLKAYRRFPPPHAPVVVVSGIPSAIAEAEALGAVDCLEKPFTLQDLRTVFRYCQP